MRIVNLVVFPLILVSMICSCSGGLPATLPPDGGTVPSADAYLGGGHPIEGINYARNNRSPYNLPTVFVNMDVYRDMFDPPGYSKDLEIHDLLIDGDEKLFISRLEGHASGGYSFDEYKLYSLVFGEDQGEELKGGFNTVLHKSGIITVHKSEEYSYYNFFGETDTSWSREVNLFNISPWPEVTDGRFTRWGYHDWYTSPHDSGFEYHGRWDGEDFDRILPLPDGTLLASYTIPAEKDSSPVYIMRLSPNLEVMHKLSLQDEITGFALDMNSGNIYVGATWQIGWVGYGYLYCLTPGLETIWDTRVSMPRFSESLPVIDDEGGVLGVYKGKLKRITGDGTPVGMNDCQARQRPALFNDGTIVVICESAILYFDTDLNVIAAIPLPSGPGTGSEYSNPPLIDANDNYAVFLGSDVWIISRHGDVLAHRTFESDVRKVRLGPEHLFVALDYAIYRFPS